MRGSDTLDLLAERAATECEGIRHPSRSSPGRPSRRVGDFRGSWPATAQIDHRSQNRLDLARSAALARACFGASFCSYTNGLPNLARAPGQAAGYSSVSEEDQT